MNESINQFIDVNETVFIQYPL